MQDQYASLKQSLSCTWVDEAGTGNTFAKTFCSCGTQELSGALLDLQATCSSGRIRIAPISGTPHRSHHPWSTSAWMTPHSLADAHFWKHNHSDSATFPSKSGGEKLPRGHMITMFTVIANDFTAVRAASAHARPLLLHPKMSTGWISLSLMRSNVEKLVCKKNTTKWRVINLMKQLLQ